jgi:hypothetical protein
MGSVGVVQAIGMKPYVPAGAFMRHVQPFQPLFRDRRLFQGFSTTLQGILASGGLRLSQIAVVHQAPPAQSTPNVGCVAWCTIRMLERTFVLLA